MANLNQLGKGPGAYKPELFDKIKYGQSNKFTIPRVSKLYRILISFNFYRSNAEFKFRQDSENWNYENRFPGGSLHE